MTSAQAHCYSHFPFRSKLQNSKLKVRCGEWDTQRTVEPVPHQDRDVKFVSVHPGFSPRNLKNDVALLHTVEPFILSAHIDIMCLPNINDLDKSFQWENCVATGWGKDKFGKIAAAAHRSYYAILGLLYLLSNPRNIP